MKKNRRWILWIILSLNILAVIPLLLSYVAGHVSPTENWYYAFFGLAYPIFLALNGFFIILWLVLWKKYIFISLISVITGWSSLQSVYPVHLPWAKKNFSGETIRVVSYNVNLFWGNENTESISEVREQISSFLRNQQADVICLQEGYLKGPDFNELLKKYTHSIGMKYFYFKNYRKFWDKKKIDAVIIFSRFPIVDTGFMKIPEKSTFAIYADILHHEDTIRIYNLHLESIRFGNDDYTFYSGLTDPMKDKPPLKEGAQKMFWKLRRAFILRANEADQLTSHISVCPYPSIIAGDFNDTPSSYTYHQLTRNHKDAFVSVGNTFDGNTYAGKFPAFRIDYLLYSVHFKPAGYHKYKLNLSDHYPIAASFTFKP
ncbi:MAG TPA: endonuclease/exonuclease/phosphatase family protein [Bacteroidales bacterium]|nr:endonuclease/exonuclease/phosphatase family protein [Bacteroidales bacterium]HPT10210.1 endonuclease/exonuclease/phosphatase family protein [Bacteroidales bacterium]